MKVLIVGYGAHTKRRIIPALVKINNIRDIHLITDRDLQEEEIGKIKIFNYSEIDNLNVVYDLILISNYPIKHIDIFEKVRNLSSKFIIEKPITSNLEKFLKDDFDSLFHEKLVYESNAFQFHPLYQKVKDIIERNNVLKIVSFFTIPNLDEKNYRYRKELGGSSILDQGVYPISLIVDLFNDNLKLEKYELCIDDKLDIDTGGFVHGKALKNIKIELYWGINQEYKNELRIFAQNKEFYFPFIYSKPENHTSSYFEIEIENSNELLIGNFDQFQLMYENVLFQTDSNGDNELDKLKYKYSLIQRILQKN